MVRHMANRRSLTRAEIVALTKKAKRRVIAGEVATPRIGQRHFQRLKELKAKSSRRRDDPTYAAAAR